MVGQPGQGGSSDSAGYADLAMALAPVAVMSLGGGNPQSGHMLAILSSLMKNRGDRDKDEREGVAAGELLTRLGLTATPGLSAAEQFRGGTLEHSLRQGEAAAVKERQAQADANLTRAARSQIAGLGSQIGTALPEDLRKEASGLAPYAGRSTDTAKEFSDALKGISDSGKSLEAALSLGRQTARAPGPEGYDPQEQLIADEGAFPGGSYRVGNTGRVAVPAAGFAEVPSNVHALQRMVAQTGIVPTEKTASGISTAFKIPLPDLPGGLEAARELKKPLAQPFYISPTDVKGGMTPITMQPDPETGRPSVTRHDYIPGVGKPQRPLAGPSGPTETVTTKTIPARPITNYDELTGIRSAMDPLVNDLAARIPGFSTKGASTVDIDGVGRVPKVKVIERAFLQQHRTGVTVRWDGKKFVVIRAWEPERVSESSTTRGPAQTRDRDAAED